MNIRETGEHSGPGLRYQNLTEGARVLGHETLSDLGSEWRELAACSGRADDLFFPANEAEPSQVRAAKAVCGACPVREECLSYAVETGQRDGVWGGLTSRERRLLRRKRGVRIRRAS